VLKANLNIENNGGVRALDMTIFSGYVMFTSSVDLSALLQLNRFITNKMIRPFSERAAVSLRPKTTIKI